MLQISGNKNCLFNVISSHFKVWGSVLLWGFFLVWFFPLWCLLPAERLSELGFPSSGE